MPGNVTRQPEAGGIMIRTVYPNVPPEVGYRLTEWGQALCPALGALLVLAEHRDSLPATATAMQ
ncbi:MAG: winged helix-turn-helix transcriptional regulator [Pseudohongiella sp.]|nr:winged helix-turn-helix transcriptional regulator [Pseudohongiella sp.]